MNDLERQWRKETADKVRRFVEEMGSVGKCIRLEAIYEQLWHAEGELADRYRLYAESKRQGGPYIERALIASFIPETETRIERLNRQISRILAVANGRTRKDRITEEMIERAREYPIESLIGSGRRGNVLCIAHEEKHPSMSLKGNLAHCFSCGFTGDSIDVYQKLHNASFVEAVKALQ